MEKTDELQMIKEGFAEIIDNHLEDHNENCVTKKILSVELENVNYNIKKYFVSSVVISTTLFGLMCFIRR